MVLGGGEQPAEHHDEAGEEVQVIASTRHETEVIEQDHQRTEPEQDEHEDRHPLRALLDGDWHRRRVAGGGFGGATVM